MEQGMKSLMLLHLSLIKGVGSQSIQNLIPYLNNIYDFDKIDFIEKSKIPSHLSNKIFCGLKNKALLNKELELIDKYNIKFFSFLDDYYPKLLKNIYYPPVIIYYKGQPLADYKDNLAVVCSFGSYKTWGENYSSFWFRFIKTLSKM
jgi:DNA processing protein